MQLNYKHFGSGAPLIIIHGLFGSLDNWQSIAKQWAENFSVYIIDLRNHGKSPHVNKHSYDFIAEDIAEFMQQQHIEKAYFLGHSMGGKAVMQFAIMYPKKVIKQIIVDIATKQYSRGHDDIFDALFHLNLDLIESRSEAEDALKEKITETGTRQFLLKNLDRNEAGQYEWKFNLEVLYRDYNNISEAIKSKHAIEVSTLVIKGANSKYISAEDETVFKTMFPKTTIASVSNAGHWVHADNPGELLTIVNRFLIG